MSHVRTQIREAVITELKKIAAFGNRVHGYRNRPAITTPDVVVSTDKERIIPEEGSFGTAGNPTLMRELQLSIMIREKAADDLDDKLDGYAVSIETAMAGTVLGSLAASWLPDELKIGMSGEMEQDVGMMILTWLVRYRTVEGVPGTAVL